MRSADDDAEHLTEPDPVPAALLAHARWLQQAGVAGHWRPSAEDRQAALLWRDHTHRIWGVDGWWPPEAAEHARTAGVQPLTTPEEILAATDAVFTRILDLDLTPETRRLYELAREYEPQPLTFGGWSPVLGAVITGDWST